MKHNEVIYTSFRRNQGILNTSAVDFIYINNESNDIVMDNNQISVIIAYDRSVGPKDRDKRLSRNPRFLESI